MAESWADLSWLQLLQKARQHPMYFGVIDDVSLVANALRAPLGLVYGWECFEERRKRKNAKPLPLSAKGVPLPRRRYFDDIGQACLHLSPHQYLWNFDCGTLRKEMDEMMGWEQDTLLTSFGRCYKTILESPKQWMHPFRTNTDPLQSSIFNMYFAQTGFVAIRSRQGLCCQWYQEGWMVTPPTMTPDVLPDVGFAVGASLTEEWFPRLPFTLEKATAEIPEALQPLIHVVWHDTDDILPSAFVKLSPLDLIPEVIQKTESVSA